MADPTTGPPLNLTLPTVGGDNNTWGYLINANLQAINTFLANLNPGGAGLATYQLIGTIDGTNTTFTAPSPVVLDPQGFTFMVFVNGLKQVFNISFTVPNASTIVFASAPQPGDLLELVN